jgi:FkbM family methyltransferase
MMTGFVTILFSVCYSKFIMMDQIIRVFNLGATVGDKIRIWLFYSLLFFAEKLGMGSSFKRPWHICFSFEGKTYDFYLKYAQDIHLLREMFIDEHYRITSDDRVKRVIDFGSNIGASLIYIAHKFPSATILAVESHPACLEMLRLNVEQFGDRVQIVPVAVCEKSGEVVLYPNGEHWSASLSHRRGCEEGICVPCESFGDIVKRFGSEDIDFVKCDIEGAEFEVFSSQETKRISRLVVEVHPSIAKRTVADYLALFPHHDVVHEEPVGDHIHVELLRSGR